MTRTVLEKLKAKVTCSRSPVFLRSDFAEYGDYRQVSRALSVLIKDGLISRVGYGTYLRSEPSIQLRPTVEEIRARLGPRIDRTITVGDMVIQITSRKHTPENAQARLDARKLETARRVLHSASIDTIRQASLEALARWQAHGTWCSAYDEWRGLMTNAPDRKIVQMMTSQSQEANRLRQSPPYIGLLHQMDSNETLRA